MITFNITGEAEEYLRNHDLKHKALIENAVALFRFAEHEREKGWKLMLVKGNKEREILL